MHKYLQNIFFVLLVTLIASVGICHGKILQVDTPLKAAVLYFPSPSVIRCLSHSDIPRVPRQANITRKIKIPGKKSIEQNITIGVHSSGFYFIGDTVVNGKTKPLKIKGGPFFNINEGGKVKLSFLFGLEDLIGLQRKIHIKDRIGNQVLDYEVFLKITKGMIGDADYNLELFGQDRVVNGETKYFLDGKGKLGKFYIIVSGKDIQKDHYEINERYGPVKVFTTVKVYD